MLDGDEYEGTVRSVYPFPYGSQEIQLNGWLFWAHSGRVWGVGVVGWR